MLTFEEARGKIIEQLGKRKGPFATAVVSVWEALGLVLAEEVKTDREYPPFDRSTRDGYAVRAKEVAPDAKLKCVGEIKAGDTVTEPLAAGTCVQIMTGAAIPRGADAVVMIEHTRREGKVVRFERAAQPGQNIVPRGARPRRGRRCLDPGCAWATRNWRWRRKSARRNCNARGSRVWRSCRRGMRLYRSRWRREHFRFETATVFRWQRKCGLPGVSRLRWEMRRTGSRSWERKSSEG